MAGKKIIAICKYGGEFVIEEDGKLSYKGGNAHAIDIDDQIKFEDFKTEVSEMFSFQIFYSMSFKYFLPGIVNNNTLISISSDKDLNRMVRFCSDSNTVDVYVYDQSVSDTLSTRFSITCRVDRITDAEIESEFSHHDPGVARINNGSFGCCPATVTAAARRWQLTFLRQPDNFYFHELQKGLSQTREAVRRLVNANDSAEIAIVDNATTAVSVVLQRSAWAFSESLYQRGDAAVVLRCAYGAVKKAVEAYFVRAGGRVVEAAVGFPVGSGDEIVRGFRKALEEGRAGGTRRVRLAVIDHVTSMPSFVVPVRELVELCREEGVERVFVDGAHGVGSVDVDVEAIGADYYTGNLHKWMFCPPSVAFLHCRRLPERDDLHHPIVSHEYGNGLEVESGWVGTRDYSALLAVPSAVGFAERFENGIEGVRRTNHDRVVGMGQMLAGAWGTGLGCPPEMCAAMVMVGLPVRLGIRSEDDALKLRTHLRREFGVEVPIFYRAPVDGEVEPITGYARISYQVYNKVDDYYKFRDAINELVSVGFTCSCLSD